MVVGDPIYRAPAPLIDEQYEELAWGMDLDYVDCTCGHPNDDHESGVCPFKGYGCGALYDDSDVTSPPGGTSDRPSAP